MASTVTYEATRLPPRRPIPPCARTPPCDRAVVEALEQRKQLLGKYGDLHPAGEAPAGPYGWTHGDFQ
ncbi:hypothetical protein AB0D27_42850, partial [Streptomyces sp. NPDC048415]